MFPLIGIIVVLGSVVAGFLLEKGNLHVLLQPAELLIIGGAAAGTVLVSNSPAKLKELLHAIIGAFGSSKYVKSYYLETLRCLYLIMQKARKDGLTSLDKDIETPNDSEILKQFPPDKKPDTHVRNFVCDTLRIAMMGGASAFDLDQVMERDMDVHHAEAHHSVAALTSVADSLPGLGIVAAVLGVVITMGALGGPPEEIGHKVAAALVGTFLGILLCYGMLSPIATRINHEVEEESHFYHVLRVAITAFLKGSAPVICVEFGRRVIPAPMRPSFAEMEAACRGTRAAEEKKAA
jgi:chemotaxis protein MotA